jgi:hypothetical protein
MKNFTYYSDIDIQEDQPVEMRARSKSIIIIITCDYVTRFYAAMTICSAFTVKNVS